MSAFSYESFRLLEQNENILFGLNIAGTLILTLAAVYMGKLIVLNFMVGGKMKKENMKIIYYNGATG